MRLPNAAMLTAVCTAAVVLSGAAGCVRAESSRYERHLSMTIPADTGGAAEDVALAFGLPQQPRVAVTAVSDK